MSNLRQKSIDQYLVGFELTDEQKSKALVAITHLVYSRNQNVIQAESVSDETKIKQHTASVNEYDQIINDKIKEVLAGKSDITYDF